MKQRFTNHDRPVPGTQAVVRALSLLRAVGGAREGHGLSKLASDHGLHKSTALRLLGALEREGFVARDGGAGTYRLGPALIALGSQARDSVDMKAVAQPVLTDLAARSGETATLETLAGDEVTIVAEAHGRFLIGAKHEVGTRWPAHATSTGKVLLAAERFASGAAPRARGRGRLARLAPRTITSRAELDRALASVWRTGYAVTDSEIERDFVAIAAPVHDALGATVAAISVGGPGARIPRTRIAALSAQVRHAAAELSSRLGASPRPAAPRLREATARTQRQAE